MHVCTERASVPGVSSGRLLVELVPGEETLPCRRPTAVHHLRAGDPFSEEMSTLWLGVQSLGFTLVCEPHENLLLAEGTLRNLTRHCLEQGSEVKKAGRSRRTM
uniref:AP-5 complex subunit sigma-1-like n=1 Tax=Monopterus albus TaxID=43700 RepID=UPI0009B403FF|nr:AP-5 complex subunit sigma-1-like [Monopterus albus]